MRGWWFPASRYGESPDNALLALFDEHWEALAQALAVSPRYVELGSESVVVYE
jgi:hypothetical protein